MTKNALVRYENIGSFTAFFLTYQVKLNKGTFF